MDTDTITESDVRRSVDAARRGLTAAAEEIVWQIEHEVWRILGYDTWNAMREAEYGGAAFMVPTAERPELVARLRETGMTQQDIARTAGVDQTTVSKDLREIPNPDPPAYTEAENAHGDFDNSCYFDPSGGVNDLKDILRSTDKLLGNYFEYPAPHQLGVIEKWLERNLRKVRRATREAS